MFLCVSSQSTEDSEPVYDQLHLDRCQSDSEPERTSSASPPICDTSPYSNVGDEVYSEIAPRDTDHLLKSSHPVKTRRSMYAGEHYESLFWYLYNCILGQSLKQARQENKVNHPVKKQVDTCTPL